MTITQAEIRAALERGVDQAALAQGTDPDLGPIEPEAELVDRRRWPRVLVAAAAVTAIAGVAVFATDDSQHVRTEPGGLTTQPGEPSTSSTSPTGDGSAAPEPSTQRVLVLNGSGTSAHAGVLTDQLAEAGYQTQPALNANDAIDPTRVYFAPGHEIAAQDLAARLRRSEVLPLPVRPLGTGETSEAAVADLVVVVGRDWSPGPLEVPADDATYQTTTTSPAPDLDPRGMLWAGTSADAGRRSTPEGTIRELLSHVEPRPTVDDVTVTPSRTAGWQGVTARVIMGDLWGNYNIPTFIELGLGDLVTGGTIAKEDLTAEWMVDNFHLVGSPDTVAAKIEALHAAVGGFGTLISFGHEYTDDPEVYRRSFELIGTKVSELVSHL